MSGIERLPVRIAQRATEAIVTSLGWLLEGVGVALGANTVTYSASMTPDVGLGSAITITATNNVAFTINAPLLNGAAISATNVPLGTILQLTIRNTSGGALGVATFNAVFKLSAWTQPGNGNSRSIMFRWDGTNWVEQSRTAADVPN